MRHWKTLAAVVTMVGAGLVPVIFATAASANEALISIDCGQVTFQYVDIPAGETVTADEMVSVDGVVTDKTFTFTGPSASDTVPIQGSDGQTVDASATFTTSDGTFSNSASQQLSGCTTPPPTCPPGAQEKANFRWHYSANGSSGSWSGTNSVVCPGSLTMGPQAMEGDLKVSPGTTLKAGYDFTVPGNKSTFSLTVGNPQVVFSVACVSGAAPSSPTLTVSMPMATYTVVGSAWYPSGDQHSPLVYQGSVIVPDLCGGGQVRLQQGGTFTATVS